MTNAPTNIKTIDEYIAKQPKNIRPLLKKIRETIRRAAPGAEESIKYQMPAFSFNGPLVYFAACKEHLGFYPTPSGITAFKKDLSVYQTSKGAIQFPFESPMPVGLIRAIVQYRMKENSTKKKRC